MAWTTSKRRAHGVRYTGMYRDADGNARSAGTSSSKRAALKAAEDEETKVRLGMWCAPGLGAITLEQYFEEWIAERIMAELRDGTSTRSGSEILLVLDRAGRQRQGPRPQLGEPLGRRYATACQLRRRHRA